MFIQEMNREEQKYYLTPNDYKKLFLKIKSYLKPHEYFRERIYNIYFDNDYDDLIINSLEKPIYKEKIRLRSYNIPSKKSIVFLEIKKKYNGLVNKRRVILTYEEAKSYLENGIIPSKDKQIMKEIDYCFKKYALKPKISITYDRDSYLAIDDENLRITFDYHIKSSLTNLKLTNLDTEKELNNGYIMEIKTLRGLPNWFTTALSDLKVYPISFSKYGEIYKKLKESALYV
jgi:SPX domain protein involved in polyphosphate accumulation